MTWKPGAVIQKLKERKSDSAIEEAVFVEPNKYQPPSIEVYKIYYYPKKKRAELQTVDGKEVYVKDVIRIGFLPQTREDIISKPGLATAIAFGTDMCLIHFEKPVEITKESDRDGIVLLAL